MFFVFLFILLVVAAAVHLERAQKREKEARRAALAALHDRDPRFEEKTFSAAISMAFVRVQEAWSAGDLGPARHLLSDGVFERFQVLLDMQKDEGRVNRLEKVSVQDCSIQRAESSEHFDTLDVHIQAACVDRYYDAKTGAHLSGGDEPQAFAEIWSFLRTRGAQTPQRPGLAAGHCPDCGTPLSINQSTLCPSCKAWVNSGQYDWVLAEITQVSAAGAGSPAPPSGWQELSALDAQLDTQSLEDRASVLFWRYLRCLADGDLAALGNSVLENALRPEQLPGRLRYKDCAVGSVTVKRVRTGMPHDTVEVEILWSGKETLRTALVTGTRPLTMTLARRHGATSVPWSGLRSLHCAGCGCAAEGPAPACPQCGRARGVEHDWVLAALK